MARTASGKPGVQAAEAGRRRWRQAPARLHRPAPGHARASPPWATHDVPACRFGVDRSAVSRAIGEVRPLLAERGARLHHYSGLRLRMLAEVIDHLGSSGQTGIIDGTGIRVRRPAAGREDRGKYTRPDDAGLCGQGSEAGTQGVLGDQVLQQCAPLDVRAHEELLAVLLQDVEGDEVGRPPGGGAGGARARMAARRCNASKDKPKPRKAKGPSRTPAPHCPVRARPMGRGPGHDGTVPRRARGHQPRRGRALPPDVRPMTRAWRSRSPGHGQPGASGGERGGGALRLSGDDLALLDSLHGRLTAPRGRRRGRTRRVRPLRSCVGRQFLTGSMQRTNLSVSSCCARATSATPSHLSRSKVLSTTLTTL